MKRQPILHLILALARAISTLWLGQSQGSIAGQRAPEFANDIWVNSEPLRLTEIKGKVVLVEFWTFGCHNCQNVEPYVKSWNHLGPELCPGNRRRPREKNSAGSSGSLHHDISA